MSDSNHLAYLQCLMVNGRLRVRIISDNYFPDLNCQFPRAIRAENQIYSVPTADVHLVQANNSDFYRIGKRNIQLVDEDTGNLKVKIFTQEDDNLCCVCMYGRNKTFRFHTMWSLLCG